jgi:hypothetical protein
MKRPWTKEEDAILQDLVRAHGKQWSFILTQIPERTATQIAARWEKCLDPNLHKGPFTPEEDQAVANFVAQHGPRCWPQIVSVLPHRSAKQCRERWVNHLDPTVVKTEWSAREDEMIFEHVQMHGPKWSQIAKAFPGRSDNAIKNRWNSSISKRIVADPNGQKRLLPDSSHRKYRAKERPAVQSTKEESPVVSRDSPEKMPMCRPPPLELPDPLDLPSPRLSLQTFSLQTPLFGTPTPFGLLTPNSPFDGVRGGIFSELMSPTGPGAFLLSPVKGPSEGNL